MRNGIAAFTIAAATLVITLASASIVVATISDRRVEDLRAQGPHMKRVGGVVLIIIGTWFAYLAMANPTYLLP